MSSSVRGICAVRSPRDSRLSASARFVSPRNYRVSTGYRLCVTAKFRCARAALVIGKPWNCFDRENLVVRAMPNALNSDDFTVISVRYFTASFVFVSGYVFVSRRFEPVYPFDCDTAVSMIPYSVDLTVCFSVIHLSCYIKYRSQTSYYNPT